MYQNLKIFPIIHGFLPIKFASSTVLAALMLAGCNAEPSPYVGDEATQPAAPIKPVKATNFLDSYHKRPLTSPTMNTENTKQNDMMHGMEKMQ
jgi:PBP1b-binding outer membrane lipoprotein LpoB